MRKFIVSAIAFLLVLQLGAQQRDSFKEIAQDPDKAGNVFYMYDHDVPAPAAAPKGYKPFYISHYGRHGARYHTSKADYNNCLHILRSAESKGMLTEEGKEYLRRFIPIYDQCSCRGGELTDKGMQQHRDIAHNMYTNYKQAFPKGAKIDANSTTVIRSILSMANFCDQLHLEDRSLNIRTDASVTTMSVLNPFTSYNPDVTPTDEGYKNKHAYWLDGFNNFCRDNLHPELLFSRLFTDMSVVSEYMDPQSAEMCFFESAGSVQCGSGMESLWEFFPTDELCRLWECINYRFYCSKGPDMSYQNGRQWAFSWRTLQHIIDQADEDIASGEYAARLRFGHDIVVMPLLVLLDVDGYNQPVAEREKVKDAWRSYDFPMALNVQLIFYRNRQNDVLVRLMYNERDIKLPIADCGTEYYYSWDTFRGYALERIALAQNIIATTQAPPKRK